MKDMKDMSEIVRAGFENAHQLHCPVRLYPGAIDPQEQIERLRAETSHVHEQNRGLITRNQELKKALKVAEARIRQLQSELSAFEREDEQNGQE